jgi:M6 family metalloprotease-like protein
LDGYTVIRDEKTNWICYASLSGTGDELLSTAIHYNGTQDDLSSLRSNLNLLKHLDMNADALKKIRASNYSRLRGNTSLSKTTENTLAPPLGKIKGLAIVVDFSDEPGTLAMSEYEDFLNGTNYTKYGNHGSIKEFYSDISGGLIEYDNIVYGFYRAPKTFKEYDAMGYTVGAQEILGLALNWIKDKGFDFSTLTITNGRIRAINLIYTGTPPTWSKGMWHHMGNYSKFSANGVTSGSYNCSPAASPLKMNVVCHENGHMIGEWPDTYKYDTNSGTDGLGAFDLMCNPGPDVHNPVWPNPYFMARNGYGKIVDVTTTGADINDPANALIFYKYRNAANAKEYFIVQGKRKIERGASFPDEGVTIWRVNTAGDNQTTTPEIALVHCNNNKDVHTGACYKSGKQEYTDNTTPNAKWLNGTASGLRVWDFGAAGEATMHYKIGTPATGISTINFPVQIFVYPNPVVDERLTIDLSSLQTNQTVVITIQDELGRTVYKEEKQNTTVTINTQAFSSGVYFINLTSDRYSSSYKLLKQ